MKRMQRLSLPFLLAALLAVPASGQALKGHNANAPVDVEADRIEVQDRADRAIFSGNVRVRQAGLSLNASRLTVAYDNAGGGTDIQRLDATGGVTVTSASETAQGEIAIYDLPRRIITMVGGVTLTQGANRISGGRLVIDLNSGRAIVDGNAAASASGADGAVSSGGGRVTGRFTVTKRDQ
jgi:lipopolysaccharide export system protein LptA